MPNYNEALNLMHSWVESESLRKHMLCVETAMCAYAQKYNADEELWAICGLLHDFDYEKNQTYDADLKTGHPYEGIKILAYLGYRAEILDAILGHAQYSNTPRISQMSKCLFACDELCGFLVACAYMRSDHFATLDAASVNKKLKNKNFAAKVNRKDIDLGVTELGIDRDEHFNFVIAALKEIQDKIFS